MSAQSIVTRISLRAAIVLAAALQSSIAFGQFGDLILPSRRIDTFAAAQAVGMEVESFHYTLGAPVTANGDTDRNLAFRSIEHELKGGSVQVFGQVTAEALCPTAQGSLSYGPEVNCSGSLYGSAYKQITNAFGASWMYMGTAVAGATFQVEGHPTKDSLDEVTVLGAIDLFVYGGGTGNRALSAGREIQTQAGSSNVAGATFEDAGWVLEGFLSRSTFDDPTAEPEEVDQQHDYGLDVQLEFTQASFIGQTVPISVTMTDFDGQVFTSPSGTAPASGTLLWNFSLAVWYEAQDTEL